MSNSVFKNSIFSNEGASKFSLTNVNLRDIYFDNYNLEDSSFSKINLARTIFKSYFSVLV